MKVKMGVVSAALYAIGLTMITVYGNWQITVGLLIIIWAMNIENGIIRGRFE